MSEQRQCRVCQAWKPLHTGFHRDPQCVGGYRLVCGDCRGQQKRARRLAKRESSAVRPERQPSPEQHIACVGAALSAWPATPAANFGIPLVATLGRRAAA
jgi:hypothetical protein